MICYHGSNSRFKTLKISKKLVKSNATLLNEGIGIYFSIDRTVAESYGKYLYTLDINDKYIKDFRKIGVCRSYLLSIAKSVYAATGINLANYINYNTIAQSMVYGQIAISNVSREIKLCLDSTEKWYQLSETKINNAYREIEKACKNTLYAYLFNYQIKGIGIIKNVNPEVVQILSCEKMY